MESLKTLFKTGNGPSSSHTMGPKRAAQIYLSRNPEARDFRVTLYGSLAATGRGHMTDRAILDVLQRAGQVEIVWKPEVTLPFHPNGMLFEAAGCTPWEVFSIGGGSLSAPGFEEEAAARVYGMTTLGEIKQWCEQNGSSYWEYVEQCEGPEIWGFIARVWETMEASVARGLEAEGTLPGGLGVRRKAADYLIRASGYSGTMRSRGMVYAYALAVAEENAAGGEIVAAPTCGSCGILPAVLHHLMQTREFHMQRLYRAIAVAGLFGNVVRTNASISGAEVGCQGEVGVACAMAAAAACQLFGGSPAQIEYAAEMGLEHHLGLTCDPVCGMVQIPCIERNAFAAARALDANTYSTFSDGIHRVSFDKVVEVMGRTGHDLPSLYKETSEGGLAKVIKPV
ncbi:MAG: L-serine ammonia-lyase, iron-sulfur-dependent, subunit alpha [Rikenellaceae bacterium]|nr:L-serine ammonia-lyase, iron-sulfur-dependent, subunit alpha [Rikenellaceae bacterium]